MRALVIEDEASIREMVRKYLERSGFEVVEAGNMGSGLLSFNDSINVVILDLNLPGGDGLEICKKIRSKSKVPIVIMTARDQDADHVTGLELGADDYIVKPFSPKVLVAHVQAVMRRHAEKPDTSSGVITLLEGSRQVRIRHGEPIALTATQFKIMKVLMSKPGIIWSRERLVQELGNDGGKSIHERTIDAHMKDLRKLVEEDPAHPQLVQTVIGSGYRLSL